jgi:ribosomal protein S20
MSSPIPIFFDPEDLVNVAKDLLNDNSESKIRTILNRCYYSCYLMIKKFENKIDATDKIPHTEVYRKLQNHIKSALKTYYYALNRYRVAADYGLESYQSGIISTGIQVPGSEFDVDLKSKQTGERAIRIADNFIYLFNK